MRPIDIAPALADLPESRSIIPDPPPTIIEPNYQVVTNLGTLLDLVA